MENKASPFLELPIELRLMIYNFALQDERHITLGSVKLTGPGADVVYRLYGNGRVPTPGLPQYHEPVVLNHYSPHLLSLSGLATIPVGGAAGEPAAHSEDTTFTLLLVNKRIRDELLHHFNLANYRTTGVFVSFPHGITVCRELAPGILSRARSVHIAGSYTPSNFLPSVGAHHHRNQLRDPEHENDTHDQSPPSDVSASSLRDLVERLLGPKRNRLLTVLEMRIYFPGKDSYTTVFGDDNSPIVIAMRRSSTAEIRLEVWRGLKGTGVRFCARPSKENKRSVTTVWKRLEEGHHGQPKCGSWVVDPSWPKWKGDCDWEDAGRESVTVTTSGA